MLNTNKKEPERFSSRIDAVGEFRIHARVSARPAGPERPPVVLLHGLVVSSRYMLPLAQRLAARCSVSVPDLPGWGKSSKPHQALSVPELADALVRWFDAVGVQRPVLVANSFGCQVAADLAARYPDRVALLVLLGPTVDPQERNFWRIAGRWLLDVPLEPPSLVFIIARDLWDMGLRGLVACIRVMLADRIEQKLPRISAPTLVVRGQRDPTVTARWAASAARLLPSGRSVAIAGAAHSVNYNSPATVTRIVEAFMQAWQPPQDAPGQDAPVPACADAS